MKICVKEKKHEDTEKQNDKQSLNLKFESHDLNLD